MAGYNRVMSEEDFSVDGSEKSADSAHNTISSLQKGPDAPAAAFNDELQKMLDATGLKIPDISALEEVGKVRTEFNKYQWDHRESLAPAAGDDKGGIALGTFKKPETEKVKEVKYKTLEEAILAQIKNVEVSKDGVASLIFPQRENIAAEVVSRSSIAAAFATLVNKGLLIRNLNGTFSRPIKIIIGGSDLSAQVKEEDKPVSKLDSIKNTLADGAEKVENWLNKDREGIDPSGEGFLGGSKFNMPSEPSSSLENKEEVKQPVLESQITRLDHISEHDQLLSVIRTTLANTKSQSGEQGITLEEYISQVNRAPMTKENIEKIGHIFEEISGMEGSSVVHRQNGTPALVVDKPKAPEQKPLGNIPQYTEVANLREQFLTEAGYAEFIKHLKQYIKDHSVISPMALLNDIGEDGYGTTDPRAFLPYLEQLEREGFLKRTVSTDEYPIFQRVWKYQDNLDTYLNKLENTEGKIPLSIKMLRHDLKYSSIKEVALDYVKQARKSEYLTDAEVEKINQIAFGEVELPDPKEVLDGVSYRKELEDKKVDSVINQEEIISGELPYPDGFEPEQNLPETTFPIPVEDPVARVKSLNEKVGEAVVEAKGVEISQNVVERFSKTRHESPIGPVYEQHEKIDEELRDKVDGARKVFAGLEVAYKKEVWEAKGKYEKIMASLGASGKQRQLPDTNPEYREAQAAYMEAKWNLKNFIAGKDLKEVPFSYSNSLIGPELSAKRVIDVGAMEQAEKEYRLFRNEVTKLTPEKQKNLIAKSLEGWTKLSLPKRYAISLTLLTVGGYALGSITVGAALGMAAQRTIRTLGGTAVALADGVRFDGIKRKEIKKAQDERRDEYDVRAETTKEEFIEKENALKAAYEEEERVMRKNQVIKMGRMAAIAGVTNVGLGMGINATSGGVSLNPDIDPSRSKMLDPVLETTPEAPAPKIYVDPVKVDLSSNGFIDTVKNLKEQLTGKTLSPKLAELMSQKPEKIAMDLGLYKPEQAAESAFGLNNEYLAVDAEGEISLVHSDGTTIDKLFDGEKANPYAGKMFDADHQETSPMPTDAIDTPVAPKVAEVIPQNPKPVIESMPKASTVEIKSSISRGEAVADAAVTTPAFVEVKARVPFEFDQTVVKSPEYTGPKDMIFGKLPLKSELQFDPKYKPERIAYNIKFERELMSLSPDAFDLRFPIEYNGGYINVIQTGKELLILLNGQKIGTGLIIDGQPGLQYEKSLGSSLLGVKSDFEKAFEVAQQGIMKNKMFFKKTQ